MLLGAVLHRYVTDSVHVPQRKFILVSGVLLGMSLPRAVVGGPIGVWGEQLPRGPTQKVCRHSVQTELREHKLAMLLLQPKNPPEGQPLQVASSAQQGHPNTCQSLLRVR